MYNLNVLEKEVNGYTIVLCTKSRLNHLPNIRYLSCVHFFYYNNNVLLTKKIIGCQIPTESYKYQNQYILTCLQNVLLHQIPC